MKKSFCSHCGQALPEIELTPRRKVPLSVKVVEKIHRDIRKKTFIARELRMAPRVITQIKSLPLQAAIDRFCR